jgi:phosphoribosylglycinamide formyltransferase-1
MARVRVAVLVSGRGSNLQALIDATRDPDYPAEIVLVASNVPEAAALARAEAAKIPTLTFDHRGYPSRAAFDAVLDSALTAVGVDLVCLAGFMRLLTPDFVERRRNRMINIHPSLLPAFPGLKTHERTLASGVRIAGCTVHFVRPETDTGPIIAQAAVPVLAGDTAETLAARILVQEHRIYPLALQLLAEGRVRVEGDRAFIFGGDSDIGASLVSPNL